MNSLLTPVFSRSQTGVYAREPFEDHLPGLRVKTLIQYGDHDWLFSPQVYKILSELKQPNIKLEVLPESGHHVYLDNQNAFHRSVNSFAR